MVHEHVLFQKQEVTWVSMLYDFFALFSVPASWHVWWWLGCKYQHIF